MRTDGRPMASAVASATGAVSTPRAAARSTALRNSVIGFALATPPLRLVFGFESLEDTQECANVGGRGRLQCPPFELLQVVRHPAGRGPAALGQRDHEGAAIAL